MIAVAVLKAMLVQIFAQPDHFSLVHADVDLPAGQVFRQCAEHGIDERIGFFLGRQQNIIAVDNITESRPSKCLRQMGQRLIAGTSSMPSAAA